MKTIEAFPTDSRGLNLICPVHRDTITHTVKITKDDRTQAVPLVEFYPACKQCIRAFSADMLRTDQKFTLTVTAERTSWGLSIYR